MTAPDPRRPIGSTAAAAFEHALNHLRRYTPAWSARPPAIAYAADAIAPLPPRRPSPSTRPRGSGDPLIAAGTRIRDGATTARALVEACLDAISRRNDELVAYATVDAARARDAAARADAASSRGEVLGPLHGIPVSIKDVIDVAGLPTRCGSIAYDELPASDAVTVQRLRQAGAIVLGKATTHEFALGVTSPQSRHPVDPTRIPGGSSGGSAISVVTGMALGSLGTDTRASIRVPAALCGVVGLKPTFGVVPTGGIVPLSWTMDHAATIASSVRDAALLLDVCAAGVGAVSPWAGSDVSGWRVGVPAAAFDGCSAGVVAAIATAIAAIEQLACKIIDVDRPSAADFEDANAAGLIVSRCEASTFHRTLALDRSEYWPEVADQLDEADGISALDYLDAQRLRADLALRLGALFAEVDILVMPTVPVVAPPITDFARYLMVLSRNAIPWSFLGYPAISVPCGVAEHGLPVGLMIVAPPGHDGPVVALASAYESALDRPLVDERVR